MVKLIYAHYRVSDMFVIPKHIPLLSVEDNEEGKAWSWWVKWGILHYQDADGNEHEIEPHNSASDCETKRPDSYEEDEDADENYELD